MMTKNNHALRVGWIGCGAMGRRMAGRLLAAGYTLRVHNRTRAAAQTLIEAGAIWAETPREVARETDVVFAMVSDDEASRAVWLQGTNAAILGLRPGAWAVECSTLTPTAVRGLGAAVADAGAAFVDAPVVGTLPQAEAGTLAFIVSQAPPAEIEAAMLVMGGSVNVASAKGEATETTAGRAAALKLAVNSLFATQIAGLSEALGFLAREGISTADALTVLRRMPVISPALMGVSNLIETGAHAPLFPIELVAKDLRYTRQVARDVGSATGVSDAAFELYERAIAAGYGDQNISAVSRLFGEEV